LKLRGYRIELGEIEHEMLQHPGVIAAAADVAGGPSGNPVLTGYLVERPGSRVDPAELREMLRRKLPKYMVPAGFVRLETLPLNSSGKLDRHALQRLQAHADGGLNENWVAPTNETEETIAQIWASVLAVDRIGIHQGFFDLGGHSLLATRVTSRLSEAFAIDLPLRAIFEFPTVAELAPEVEKLRSTRPPGEEVELVARSRQLTMVPTDVR
jgi:acyl carrier protein